jgi:hypothetical protein
MKKMFLIAAALFAAICFASCSNPAGGSGDSGGQVSGGTTGGQTNGGESPNNGGQQGGENTGGQQGGQSQTVQGLDFTKIDYKYNLNAGDTVQIAGVMSDTYTIIRVESLNESVAKAFSQDGKFYMTGVSAGTAFVKACFKFNGLEDDSRYFYRCDVTVTGSSSGGGNTNISQDTTTSEGLKNFLIGTWTCSGTSVGRNYLGTIELKANMTGHINMTLGGDTIHNKDFTWTAYTTKYTNSQTGYTTAKTLSISGANEGAIDGDHTITTGTNRFTLKDYLAFGMPQTTEWTKQ